jgi:hypothetical protein
MHLPRGRQFSIWQTVCQVWSLLAGYAQKCQESDDLVGCWTVYMPFSGNLVEVVQNCGLMASITHLLLLLNIPDLRSQDLDLRL